MTWSDSKVQAEHHTEVVRATTYAGQAGVAIRFAHNESDTSATILGLTSRAALELAVQLIKAVGTVNV
jgi:hypothetical protein